MRCFFVERLVHPQRDESLKNKQDACRHLMERLVSLFKFFSSTLLYALLAIDEAVTVTI
jgi:hypothetical protein